MKNSILVSDTFLGVSLLGYLDWRLGVAFFIGVLVGCFIMWVLGYGMIKK
jgi:uncharacterized integral membrane protein